MIIKNKIAKIQIWDAAGQERYTFITSAYYRGATAIIICCDSANKQSFYNNKWNEEISKYTDEDVDKLILMNKCDLIEERKIDNNDI